MPYMPWIILRILISYLIGSIPTAYIFGRLLKGIDIRNFGSGNVGATNALRVLGKGPAITVLVLDILKGLVAVAFLGNEETLRIIFGLGCILGHNWPVFLGFKGGKGIATSFGVLAGLSIKIAGLRLILLLAVLTWILILAIVRIVSVASISTAVFLPMYMVMFRQSKMLISLSILLCIFVILRHKSNLKRVFQGKEPRLTFKKSV